MYVQYEQRQTYTVRTVPEETPNTVKTAIHIMGQRLEGLTMDALDQTPSFLGRFRPSKTRTKTKTGANTRDLQGDFHCLSLPVLRLGQDRCEASVKAAKDPGDSSGQRAAGRSRASHRRISFGRQRECPSTRKAPVGTYESLTRSSPSRTNENPTRGFDASGSGNRAASERKKNS